jgi:hypothetical protein
MQEELKPRWMALCEQAAVEQDPTKLLELTKQINDLLAEKWKRLEQRRPVASNSSEQAKQCGS